MVPVPYHTAPYIFRISNASAVINSNSYQIEYQRNSDWKDNYTIFNSIHFNLANSIRYPRLR